MYTRFSEVIVEIVIEFWSSFFQVEFWPDVCACALQSLTILRMLKLCWRPKKLPAAFGHWKKKNRTKQDQRSSLESWKRISEPLGSETYRKLGGDRGIYSPRKTLEFRFEFRRKTISEGSLIHSRFCNEGGSFSKAMIKIVRFSLR